MAGASDPTGLRRALGKWDLTAIGVNQVIGSAIFLLPADVAKQVGPWGPAAFMAVGLLSLSIALCFAEVGSRFDTTGGPYLPARAAFGRFVGFEVGWMMWFARVTSHASVVNGLTLALAFYWPSLAAGLPRAATITALTLVLMWINLRGIRQSSWFVNVLTVGKLLPLAIFIIGGIWFIDPARFTAMPPVSQEQISAVAILLIFAYGGYEVTGVLAGEAANPRKDVPFAFVACLITVSVVMSLTSLVATGVLTDVAATRTPLADGAGLFLGAWGAAMISIGSVVSMTGNNMGQLLNGSRTIFALAENGDLPRWFGKVHADYRTPSNAILFGAGVALVLALSGSFVTLAAVSAIARLVMYLAVCMSTLVLRKRDRAIAAQVGTHVNDPLDVVAPPRFTVPLGPVIPVVAAIVALGILAGATPAQLRAGGAALLAGAVLYWLAPKRSLVN
ncbi:MAG: amino acid permease [Acidimicrobiia bacterium]|nr:amino acid permease [Acidimicrobiia bacterium]